MTNHYQTLLAKYEHTKPFRGRKDDPERPLETPTRRWQTNPNYDFNKGSMPGNEYGAYVDNGFRRRGAYTVTLEPVSRDLTLRYYKSRAAVLHADGRVSVTNTTYGGDHMINPHLPDSIRPISSSGICFIGKVGEQPMYLQGSNTSEHARVVNMRWYGTVTFKPGDDGLWQLDGEPPNHWTIERIDTAKAREVSRAHNFPDFVNWHRAYSALTDDRNESDGSNDHEAVIAALLKRDFLAAFHNLEPVERKIFGYGHYYNNQGAKVTMRSIERARLRLYAEHGCILAETAPLVSIKDWRQRILRNPCRAT